MTRRVEPDRAMTRAEPEGTLTRRVELRIGALVLEGVRPADAAGVGEALEGELARLVRDGGVPAAVPGDTAAPVIARASGEPAAALGKRVAGAVYGRLGG